jgi:outer membrane protein OmpA-like peptidoglycan-associated protein
MGGFDIFKTTLIDKEKNEWSEPVNLGYPINTPDDDIFYIATKDGKRGYYASVREDGLGYQDIYMIIVPEEKEQPKNEVATTAVEPIIPKEDATKKTDPIIPAKTDDAKNAQKALAEKKKLDSLAALAKNNATKTDPKKDLVTKKPVQKEEPKKEVVVKKPVQKEEPKKLEPLKYIVKVIDESSETPLDAKVKLQGFKDNVMVGVSSSSTGVYEFSITVPSQKQYRLSVEKEGYVFVNQALTIEGAKYQAKQLSRVVALRKLSVGVSSVLRNVYFDFDKATLKHESMTELNKLEQLLRQNSNITVEIGGHCDIVGSKLANLRLSQARANAVRNFLVSKGIDPRRVKAQGYGKDRPLASNDDEKEGRELNRRVEFKVLTN